MACHGGPDIVEDNLVLCLDAANTKSYPGTGATWTDIMGGNDGTLTNEPTFSSDNGGYLIFDGTNDYVNLGTTAAVITSGSFTVEAWAYKDSTTAENSLFNIEDSNQGVILLSAGKSSGSSDDYRFTVRKGAYGANPDLNLLGTVSGVGLNEWHHFVGTFDNNTGTAILYIDGSQIDNATNTSVQNFSFSGTLNVGIQIGVSAGTARFHDGRISQVRAYTSALSASEVQQNYNALKGRFGL